MKNTLCGVLALSCLLCCLLCCLFFPPAARAETPGPWSARLGLAEAIFAPSISVDLAGERVPGAEIEVAHKRLPLGELGYRFADRWTARLALATPQSITLKAGGSLRALTPPLTGTVAEVTIVPIVLTVTYALGEFHGLVPYIGAGLNHTRVVRSAERDVAAIDAGNTWGAALQAGVEWPIAARWSVYADVRKLYIKSKASGVVPALGGPPVRADVALDPLIVSTGIQYRF